MKLINFIIWKVYYLKTTYLYEYVFGELEKFVFITRVPVDLLFLKFSITG